MLPIYAFYYYAKIGVITESWIRKCSLVLFVMVVALFYRNQAAALQNSWSDEVTNNMGYEFLALIPVLIFWRNKLWVQYLLLFVCTLFIVMAMKRGAIIICAGLLIYFLYRNYRNAKSTNERFTIFAITLGSIGLGYYYISKFIASSAYFQARVDQTLEGDASNRDVMYPAMLRYFLEEANTLNFLFGGGADYTFTVIGDYAHNDWFELAINNGLLGIILYMSFFFASRFDIKLLFMQKQKIAATTIAMSTIILFARSLFSMSYWNIPVVATLILGYCLAQIHVRKI